ncbi:MASE1 domain-containing protein [Myxacorys almedinensis]|uniref:histidine kinase n=1 Tax=Myxacorys almedinensis A TaxID=2690445 RepID=A0A8J8CK83_9CYAN|nr:MASE1 domain-containing protein [Myxacorys almedinensis]NDJ16385.1 GAF domain-containing protein [Myxacorys almedinensis A]
MFLGLTQLGRYWLKVAVIALAYFLSAKFAFAIAQLGSRAAASVLYPPIGISLAGVLLFGRNTWVGVPLGAILFARSLANVTWLTAFGAAFGNTIEIVSASLLLQQIGFQPSLRRIRDVLALVGLGAVATSLNAVISTVNGVLAGLVSPDQIVSHSLVIWLGDWVSILVLTPALLVWLGSAEPMPNSLAALKKAWKARPAFRRRIREITLWLGLLLICSAISAGSNSPTTLLGHSLTVSPELAGIARPLLQYLPFPFMVWAALRLGLRGTVFSAVLLSLIVIWGVAHHPRSSLGENDVQQALFQLQTFLGVMTITALVLVAAIAERSAVEAELLRRIQRDQLLAEITLRVRRSLDVTEVLNTTVAEVRQFLSADRCHIALFDSQGYSEIVAESVSSKWRSTIGERSPFPIFNDIAEIFRHKSIWVTPDVAQLKQNNKFFNSYYETHQIKASLSLPILQDGKLFGALNVHQCSGARQWQAFEIELLDRLVTQIELALQQGRLYQQIQNFANNLEYQVQERTLQLQHQMGELESINAVKDTLLHAVAHDLRTPMMGMKMVLQRLKDKPDVHVSVSKNTVDLMVESTDRQLSLIQSLLEDAATEPEPLILDYQAVNFVDLVQTTLSALEPQLAENQVVLTQAVLPDLPALSADPVHIKRVLEYLIINALNHNRPGIKLTIDISVIETSHHSMLQYPMLRCAIADNGVGMAQEQCDRVFKKPYLRGSYNRHRTGLGLGLFLCSQIVTAHRGNIGIISEPHAGTEVWFTLPLCLPQLRHRSSRC